MSSRAKEKATGQPVEARIYVSLLKAADALSQEAEQLVRSQGLTGAQYNVLRILRGAEPDGLPCRGISERMISHDPDMTRLLDRMEKRGMITRERQREDRRVVKTRITEKGLEILAKLDSPVRELHREQLRHVSQARLKELERLLEEVAARAPK
ncbi:MAG TPA: MarR family transcriptional regulator [Terriglobales bacterium]|nr:MarR family transcriptional regulator [Terriglobales bacterium]